MANTIATFRAYAGQTLTAHLTGEVGASGAPAAGGYACTEARPGTYSLTIPEALVGEFEIYALDDGGYLAATGYLTLADDAGVYRAYDAPAPSTVDLAPVMADLATIKAKTALIGTGAATVAAPVSITGQLSELVIGDAYLSSIGRALSWTFDAPGFAFAGATAVLSFDGLGGSLSSVGGLTDNGDGTWTAAFDVPGGESLGALESGDYTWAAVVRDASNNRVTFIRNAGNNYKVRWVAAPGL